MMLLTSTTSQHAGLHRCVRHNHYSSSVTFNGLKSSSTGRRKPCLQPIYKRAIQNARSLNSTISPGLSTPSTAADSPEQHAQEQVASSASKPFAWTRNWYPAIPLEYLDPSRPTAVQLLGRSLVLWCDQQGTWRCFQDLCPHRLAPLSEGRVEGGELMCSYHGWRFDGQGSCTAIPQAADEKSFKAAAASHKSCAKAFPVQVSAGMVWVWPDDAPTASEDAAATPLTIPHNMLHKDHPPISWFMRELPYDYDVLMENLVDPSHVPFSHHNLIPAINRNKADPTLMADGSLSKRQAQLAATPYPPLCSYLPTADKIPFNVYPPVLITHVAESFNHLTVLCGVPSGPGHSRVFLAKLPVDHTLPHPFIKKWLPTWVAHLTSQKLFDGDSVFLNMQSAVLRSQEAAAAGSNGLSTNDAKYTFPWSSAYFMPMSADKAVVGFRRWLDRVGGGGPTYAPGAVRKNQASKREILNRWEQHTKHCPHCRPAEARISTAIKVAQAVLAAAFLALCGLTGSRGLAGMVTGDTSLAVTAATLLVAAAAAAVWKVAAGLLPQFHFVDFVHAEND